MGIEWDEAEITAFLSFTQHQWTPPCVDRGMCDRRAGVGRGHQG
jgi:hypothetical protein